MRLLITATATLASLIIGGCGSTVPVGPSSVPSPAIQYPPLVGAWAGEAIKVTLQYVDPGDGQPYGYGCHLPRLGVDQQTGGAFSGGAILEGGAGESGRHCTYSFNFTAEMTADGTITSFRPDRPHCCGGCRDLSETRFSGTATSTAIRITMTDRGSCIDPRGQFRDTYRTLTISVIPVRPLSANRKFGRIEVLAVSRHFLSPRRFFAMS